MSEEILEINRDHVVHDTFEGETVIINFNTGRYFSLSGCAPFIWRLLEHSPSQDDLLHALAARYGIADEAAAASSATFLETIITEQLVLTKEGRSKAEIESQPDDRPAGTFEPPGLEIYNDLEDMIQLDPVHETAPDRGWPARLPSEPEGED